MVQRLLRGLGMLAWVAMLALAFVVSSYLAFSQFVRRGEITLPDLVGMALEQGEAKVGDLGVRLERREDLDVFDEDVPAGHIVNQSPSSGTPIKRGSVVEVALSRGRQTAEVPNLLGQPMQTVLVHLEAADLTLGRALRVYSDAGVEGRIVRQSPPAGTMVDPRTPVDVFVRVADVADTFVMPDLIYRDYDRVRGFFETRGFRVGSVKFEPYEGARPGAVLRQHPLPGHPLARDDVISLVVAAGGRTSEGAS